MRALFFIFSLLWFTNAWAQSSINEKSESPKLCSEKTESKNKTIFFKYSPMKLPGHEVIAAMQQETPKTDRYRNLEAVQQAVDVSNLANVYSTRLAGVASFTLSERALRIDKFTSDYPKWQDKPLDKSKIVLITDYFKSPPSFSPKMQIADGKLSIKVQGTESIGAGVDLPTGSLVLKDNMHLYYDPEKKCVTTTKPTNSKAKRSFHYRGFGEVAKLTSSGARVCSAVLVAPKMALTAAHCPDNGNLVLELPQDPSCESPDSKTSPSTCQYSTRTVSLSTHPNLSFSQIQIETLTITTIIPDIALLKWSTPLNPATNFPKLVSIKGHKEMKEYEFVRAGYGYTEKNANGNTQIFFTVGSWSSTEKPTFKQSSNESFGLMFLKVNEDTGSRICRYDSGGAVYLGSPHGYEAEKSLVAIISKGIDIDASTCRFNYLEGHALITPQVKEWICKQGEMKGSRSCPAQ